jgi:hypothetical protein
MRRFPIFILAAACLLFSSASFGADERNITVYNKTGYGIKFIGVNPPDDEDFDDNEISEVLKDGDSVYIKFNQADKGCTWNIKLDWAMQGYPSPMIRNLNLCNVNDITLTYDKSTDVTTAHLR